MRLGVGIQQRETRYFAGRSTHARPQKPANAKNRHAHGVLVESEPERRIVTELAQSAKRGDEGFLGEVVDQLIIAQEPADVRADLRLMQTHELGEGLHGAPCRSTDLARVFIHLPSVAEPPKTGGRQLRTSFL